TNELLSIVDVLITDYSSICFDFMHLNRPIIYFAYDYEEYKRDRGLYIDLNSLPGVVCNSIEEVILNLNKLENFTQKYMQTGAIDKYCAYDDGKASLRFLDAIFNNDEKYVTTLKFSNKKRILIYGGSLDTN